MPFLDEGVMGSGGIVPRVLDVVTDLTRMVSFTSRQFYSPDDIAGTYGVEVWVIHVAALDAVGKKNLVKVNVYLSSLMVKVPDHVSVLG
jgi:hypothetical protein